MREGEFGLGVVYVYSVGLYGRRVRDVLERLSRLGAVDQRCGAVRCGAAYGAHSAVVRQSTYPILQQRLDGMRGVDCWCLLLSSNSSVVAEASLSVSSMSCCCLETARKYRRTGSRDGVESHTSHSLYSIDGIPRDHYEIGLQLSLPYLTYESHTGHLQALNTRCLPHSSTCMWPFRYELGL